MGWRDDPGRRFQQAGQRMRWYPESFRRDKRHGARTAASRSWRGQRADIDGRRRADNCT